MKRFPRISDTQIIQVLEDDLLPCCLTTSWLGQCDPAPANHHDGAGLDFFPPCSHWKMLIRCSDISLEKNAQNSENIWSDIPSYRTKYSFISRNFTSSKLTKPVFLRQRRSSKILHYLEYFFSVNIIRWKIFNNNKMNFWFFLWIELIGPGSSANLWMKIILFVRN